MFIANANVFILIVHLEQSGIVHLMVALSDLCKILIVTPSDMLVKAVELQLDYQNALGLSDSIKSLVISH